MKDLIRFCELQAKVLVHELSDDECMELADLSMILEEETQSLTSIITGETSFIDLNDFGMCMEKIDSYYDIYISSFFDDINSENIEILSVLFFFIYLKAFLNQKSSESKGTFEILMHLFGGAK